MNARTEPALLAQLSNQHLDALEEETIFILREVAAAFERPTLLFSGGKDSLVLLKCAEKAFGIGRIPYPLLMIDTGHNFSEVTDFRDQRAAELGAKLIVRSVEDSMARGTVRLASSDPAEQPVFDHQLLSDADMTQLIAACRRHRGDEAEFVALFRRHAAPRDVILHGIMGPAQDADTGIESDRAQQEDRSDPASRQSHLFEHCQGQDEGQKAGHVPKVYAINIVLERDSGRTIPDGRHRRPILRHGQSSPSWTSCSTSSLAM